MTAPLASQSSWVGMEQRGGRASGAPDPITKSLKAGRDGGFSLMSHLGRDQSQRLQIQGLGKDGWVVKTGETDRKAGPPAGGPGPGLLRACSRVGPSDAIAGLGTGQVRATV